MTMIDGRPVSMIQDFPRRSVPGCRHRNGLRSTLIEDTTEGGPNNRWTAKHAYKHPLTQSLSACHNRRLEPLFQEETGQPLSRRYMRDHERFVPRV